AQEGGLVSVRGTAGRRRGPRGGPRRGARGTHTGPREPPSLPAGDHELPAQGPLRGRPGPLPHRRGARGARRERPAAAVAVPPHRRRRAHRTGGRDRRAQGDRDHRTGRRIRRRQPSPGARGPVHQRLLDRWCQRPERDARGPGHHALTDATNRSTHIALISYREALHSTPRPHKQRDEDVFLIGEEIGTFEGSYKIPEGLLEEFGPRRVRDTPISEEGFTGIAIGAAMLGLRPVLEYMTLNFSLLALDQVVNHAAKIYTMFGGQTTVPMVIRAPGGGGQDR